MLLTVERQIEFVAEWVSLFMVPGQVVESRALEVRGAKAVTHFFDDPKSLAVWAVEQDRAGAKGVYFTPNALRPDLLGSRGSARKADVVRRRWLLIDVDAVKPAEHADNPTNDAERQAAWDVLDVCKGTLDGAGLTGGIVADSGNAWHLCYPIDLPNDDAAHELVKAVLVGLGKRCNSEAAQVDVKCHDAPRIWKVYGTMARKGVEAPGRQHRYARLIDGRPWEPEAAARNTALLPRLLEMWQWIEDTRKGRPAGDVVSRAKAFVAKADLAVQGQHGSDKCYRAAAILVNDFGLDAAQALEAIQDWNARCTPPWSQKELEHKIDSVLKKPSDKERGWRAREVQPSANGSANGVPAPEPTPTHPDDVATIDDLIRCGAEIRWLWPGWIQVGVLNILAAEGGTGKTRFCADLLRRIHLGMLWPDGTPISQGRDAQSLWVLADNHHDEMVTLAQAFGIKDAIRLNASRSDPYGGIALDTPQDLAALEGRIEAVKPIMVIIDTVGNATDRNLSKQEDAKAFYQPLQIIARRHQCAVLCLTHLSAGGNVLGRRAKEKVRSLIQLDRPDPGDERRKLWVSKSNSKYPPPLGVTMGDHGNEYDEDPPSGPDAAPKLQPKNEKVREWLQQRLAKGPDRVFSIRKDSDTAGFNPRDLYAAKDAGGVEEYLVENKKWWRLTKTA